LGYCYFYGEGVRENRKRAVYWYKKAAAKQDDKALFNLALCCKYGQGVPYSVRWAKYYLKKASELGHKRAKDHLKELIDGDFSPR
jgi:TPR repeat protein